jgi:hypothetical protein
MRRLIVCILMLACIHVLGSAQAGEIIRFEAGAQASTERVLTHVPVKALVAEFLDPGDTGIGKSVGYLVWREILTAISDQSGAGVILARAPGEQRLTDMLEHSYHSAAVKIAREQKASMVLWGAVSTPGNELYLSTYLSLLPEVAQLQLKLRLTGEPRLPPGLEAEITRTNFNFPLVEMTRAKLFNRRIVTRAPVALRARANGSAAVVMEVPRATALEAVDMDKGWFKVRLKDGRFAYLDNSAVDVPPSTVEADGVKSSLYGVPGGQRINRAMRRGSYAVLDMRYVQRKGIWYQLEVDGKRGWISATAVRPRFSLPIVHFVAGLYRYQFKRYDDAQAEFSQYLSAPNSAADNPCLATAYQLLGASALLSKPTVFDTDPSVTKYFSNAVNATPYDSNAYSLRALSTLAIARDGGKAVADLDKAMKLDPMNISAFRIADTIRQQLVAPHGGVLMYMLRDSRDPALKRRLEELTTEHKQFVPEPIK